MKEKKKWKNVGKLPKIGYILGEKKNDESWDK